MASQAPLNPSFLIEPSGWSPVWNPLNVPEASWSSHSLQNGHSCASWFDLDIPLHSPPWVEDSDTASLSSTATGGFDLTAFGCTPEQATSDSTQHPPDSNVSWNPTPHPLQPWDDPVTFVGFVNSTPEPTTATTSSRPSPPEQTPTSADLPQEQERKKKRGRPRIYPEGLDSSTEKRVKLDFEFSTETATPTNASAFSAMSSPGRAGLDGSATNASSSPSPAIRERNRAAAWRYRHKIQTQIQGLEAQKEEVTSRRRSLMAYVDQLRGEVFDLKNMVLEHANCNFPPIQNYLSNEVRQTWGLQVRNEHGGGPSSFPGMG